LRQGGYSIEWLIACSGKIKKLKVKSKKGKGKNGGKNSG
jgi:hypothetical protein